MNTQLIPAAPEFNLSLKAHLHREGDRCPSCGQDIPLEKLEEISGKIALREREQAHAITSKLAQQYEAEKMQAAAKATAELDLERSQSVTRVAHAREEAEKAAEIVINEKLRAADRAREEVQATCQKQIDEAETARKAAEQTGIGLQTQMSQLRLDSATALETAKVEAQARESKIRTEAAESAELAAAEKIAAITTASGEAEAVLQAQIAEAQTNKTAAEQKRDALELQLAESQKSKDVEIAKVKAAAEARESKIRTEAAESADVLVRDKLAANEQTVADAQRKAIEAEGKLTTLTEKHASELAQNLASLREVLEKSKDDALNLERAKAFEEHQKLTDKVNGLQRDLEKKTNDELGEGAEIDLFEALKEEFPDDNIKRIPKGSAGADIRHIVMLHGKECGTIIYDSKNHKGWRWDHVTKLKDDQLADKAEHAILSTHKFPEGARQLHIHDGIVLANPARVVSIASMIRLHLLQAHTLRLSSIERENKTAALYDFITSEQCTQLLSRVDERAAELLEQQVNEKKWHEKHWQKQGASLRAIQKVKADLENQISAIIGTSTDESLAGEGLQP
jgi:hypothetical protein